MNWSTYILDGLTRMEPVLVFSGSVTYPAIFTIFFKSYFCLKYLSDLSEGKNVI